MKDNSFHRTERLKSRKVLQALFREGQSFGHYPFRLVWLPMQTRLSTAPVQFAVSVPRKKFPRAVARNRIKRLIREAYRRHKSFLYEGIDAQEPQIAWMVIYTGQPQEELTQEVLARTMREMMKRFLKKRRSSTGKPTP